MVKKPATGWKFKRATTTPGEMLPEEFLKPFGISQNRLALDIRVPATRIGQFVRGKRAIGADTALRLGSYFDMSPQFWLNLQQTYDLSKAMAEQGKTIEREVKAYAAPKVGKVYAASKPKQLKRARSRQAA
jgi:addiction module HigA family antidote